MRTVHDSFLPVRNTLPIRVIGAEAIDALNANPLWESPSDPNTGSLDACVHDYQMVQIVVCHPQVWQALRVKCALARLYQTGRPGR